MARHVYILDTCVVIHDPLAIYKFAENEIYLPLAVIDDLDSLKSTPGTVGYSAREVLRQLDQFNLQEMSNGGIVVNEQGGKLHILNTETKPANNVPDIIRGNSDNALILACLLLQEQHPDDKVSIVTKDIGLRIRATSWGCLAENYQSDLITDEIYTGLRKIQIDSSDDWDMLWLKKEYKLIALPEKIQLQLSDLHPNEFVVFSWQDSKCFAMYKDEKLHVLKDKKQNGNGYNNITRMGITPRNIEQRCAMEALDDPAISMVSICGPAGTGKTLCTLAVALDKINQGAYDKIVILKPLVPVSGRDIGFLPGDKFEKIVQWLGPYRDNLSHLIDNNKMKEEDNLELMVEEGILEVEAMTFIQGRSIPRSFIIVDEAQNLSPRECRMIVERCAKGSKIALLGDLSQVENPFLDAHSCGLAHAMNGGKGKKECAAITLNKVERSSLAAIASEIFKQG